MAQQQIRKERQAERRDTPPPTPEDHRDQIARARRAAARRARTGRKSER